MKGVFGLVSLLIALAVVGVLASRQLKALPAPAASAPATAQPQAQQQIQQQVRDDLNRALQQGEAQRAEADK